MININYTSPNILEFLEGRDYLLAKELYWINGQGQQIAINSMDSKYQLDCIKWLVMCLDDLLAEVDEVKDKMKPLIINKMENFIEKFPIVVKKESEQLSFAYKTQYKELEKNFKEKLRKISPISYYSV
jgi:hypothetical protein